MVSNILLDFFREGGLVFMLPLLALSILSLAIMLERTWFLARQAMQFKRFTYQCEQASDAVSLDACWNGPGAKTIAHAILHDASAAMTAYGSQQTFEQAIERSADRYTPLLAKNLWMLRAIGQIAPFIGLTGTVVGLAMAFRGIAEAGLSQQSVAKGIAMALNTTILGLFIALPTLFAEHTLRAWAQSQFRSIGIFLDEIALRRGAVNR
jgi:biopolymer transport protein ExbB